MSFIVINKELSFGLLVGPKNDRTFLKTSSHDYINTEIYIYMENRILFPINARIPYINRFGSGGKCLLNLVLKPCFALDKNCWAAMAQND